MLGCRILSVKDSERKNGARQFQAAVFIISLLIIRKFIVERKIFVNENSAQKIPLNKHS